MDTDKIIKDLNRRFAAPLPEFYQRRIIFWYDEDKVEDLKGNAIKLCVRYSVRLYKQE